MKLISCDNCGVVIDKDRLKFSGKVYDTEGNLDETKVIWHDRDYHSYLPCPVCEKHIIGPEV